MHLLELGAFDVAHQRLAWPWIAIAPGTARFAFVTAGGRIATRALEAERLVEGASFALPAGLGLPTKRAPAAGHRGAEAGLHGLALDPAGGRVALVGTVDGASVVASVSAEGELARTSLAALAGGDLVGHAITFDRRGERLWVSAASATESALLLVDAATHAVLGDLRSAPFPPPASHELFVHPDDDAVLLLAACGQDGTFARVAGFAGGPPVAIPTALDRGGEPAGFVGFSRDGARVHLVGEAALATRAWPTLERLVRASLPDDFAPSFAGVVLGDRLLVDGADADTGDVDAVLAFDPGGTRGAPVKPPVPAGMWVGRLGADALVTVEAKGEPARGRVVRLPPPPG